VSELFSNDIGGSGGSGDSGLGASKVAPGQFDDVLPAAATTDIPDCLSSSLKKPKDVEISLTLVDDIENKGQGGEPATSVLAGVPTSGN
jgi:hypothetical protein